MHAYMKEEVILLTTMNYALSNSKRIRIVK